MPTLILVLVSLFLPAMGFAAEPNPARPENPQYELQVIQAKPGKLDALHAWFRAHEHDVLAKHGAENVAYLVPVSPKPENTILAVYKYPSTAALLAFSRAVKADPRWKALDTANPDSPELLVAKLEIMTLTPTDYSPEFTPEKALQPRVFELRTYTCPTPEKLAHLHARFREHTMGLFKKHGMENLVYWQPLDGENSDRKLVYLLGHKSRESAKESFAAFRKDPDWLAVREASEKRAGGSLTNAESGVVSEFFTATDYSPLR